MDTKYLMISSSFFMGLIGLLGLFTPTEILDSVGLATISSIVLPTLLLQITGALYLGFAIMNWMVRAALIGGIYSRPLCVGNLWHFMIGGLVLIRVCISNTALKYVILLAMVYSLFAILFGLVLLISPTKK